MTFINAQPTLVATAVRAILLAAIAFGLKWTVEQLGAFMLAVEAILALFNWSKVTPTAAPSLPVGTPVKVEGRPDEPPPDAVVALRSELRGAQPRLPDEDLGPI